jgi:sister-chromatid-cohesion protein PDS5
MNRLRLLDSLPPEVAIDRFIHLLAHHPDFGMTNGDMEIFTNYIDFYISFAVTKDNAYILYYQLHHIKMSLDTYSGDETQVTNRFCRQFY